MKLQNPTYVVIHTAATPGKSIDISAASIREYHIKEKGWTDIGYHWVVRFDGHAEPGRAENVMGAHVEGFNSKSLGVCFSGNGDLSDFTPEQKSKGAQLVAQILERHGLVQVFLKNPMHVLGHRECNELVKAGVFPGPKTSKTCPGTKVAMTEFRHLVKAAIGELGLG